ncbi:GNAT family N-acetyltransferase [Cellvibrio polysaccharolyticus]|uniref:GNAT family N-acetyltransferase n=1 Tax=Cellvibrio polysaccharolyticus TaxID=2082724 RepID=A0A928V3Q9_9GAMM|nr:GNAT family N-acetyltransferase [Cellvibrio polysaccharolyticus]MBE8716027.1 GNAT family N-acetyltransferase [Cellvibrio polysaccharolyticus]
MPDSSARVDEIKSSPKIDSFFRSEAWLEAWIDTYGKDPRITLIDPFGRNNPREIFYRIKSPVRKWLSFQAIALAGTAIHPLSAPRSEYNYVGDFLCDEELFSALGNSSWSQIVFKDMAKWAAENIELLAAKTGWSLHSNPQEVTYYVSAADVSVYKASLAASTRARYFNRRERLKNSGELEFREYDIRDADAFFDVLDSFHCIRWGQPCYTSVSRSFLKNFMQRFVSTGAILMQAMLLNGKPISVLYDVLYKGRRYNLQSGFSEHALKGISPGALHMGYAIETAIESGQEYDFLAGSGKNQNYKAGIANRQEIIQTVTVEKSNVKIMRGLKQFVSALNKG